MPKKPKAETKPAPKEEPKADKPIENPPTYQGHDRR